MHNDESSQILGPCIAMANSPLLKTMQGALGFIETGIPREKLVVGLPWYGYDYTCESLTSAGECTISEVPFRGTQAAMQLDTRSHSLPSLTSSSSPSLAVCGTQPSRLPSSTTKTHASVAEVRGVAEMRGVAEVRGMAKVMSMSC